MDDRRQRIVVHEDDAVSGERAAFMGWEVADGSALDELAASLEAKNVPRAARAASDRRRDGASRISSAFDDPIGNRLEAFHGRKSPAIRSSRDVRFPDFRTGPLGMGHIVLNVERIDDLLPFYRDTLGFHLSDYTLRPFKAYFFHLNPRHHSFAMVETGQEQHPSPDDGALHAGRRRTGVRPRARRRGPHRDDARPAHERFHDVVLRELAVGVLRRVRLGRTIDRAGELEARGNDVRAEPVGPRSQLAVAGGTRAGPRAAAARPPKKGSANRCRSSTATTRSRPGTCPWWDAARKPVGVPNDHAASPAPPASRRQHHRDDRQQPGPTVPDRRLRAVRPVPHHGRLRRPVVGLRGAGAVHRMGHEASAGTRRQLHADGRAHRVAALQHARRQDRPPAGADRRDALFLRADARHDAGHVAQSAPRHPLHRRPRPRRHHAERRRARRRIQPEAVAGDGDAGRVERLHDRRGGRRLHRDVSDSAGSAGARCSTSAARCRSSSAC